MNLSALLDRRPDPGDVKHTLKARFDRVHYRATGYGPIEIVARDVTGRIRLRLPFFWVEHLQSWIYLIEKGEPA